MPTGYNCYNNAHIKILIILFCSIISYDNDYKIRSRCVISYNYQLKRIFLSHITFFVIETHFLDVLFDDTYLYVLFLGTVMEPTKLSNRLIVLLMFIFSLVTYQFYSSSIVSGLLRPAVMNIDSVQKLEESGLDVGVEDFNVITKVIEVRILLNCILYCKIVLKCTLINTIICNLLCHTYMTIYYNIMFERAHMRKGIRGNESVFEKNY